MINDTNPLSVKGKTLLLTFLIGFTVYWFGNAVLWIPWVINKWLGIAVMLILVPFLWGFASIYCLKHIPKEHWKSKNWLIAIVLLFVSILSDYFFFAVWRGVPDQLYHPTTFAAYGLILIMPFITSLIFRKRKFDEIKSVSPISLIILGILSILFFLITLYCVRFW